MVPLSFTIPPQSNGAGPLKWEGPTVWWHQVSVRPACGFVPNFMAPGPGLKILAKLAMASAAQDKGQGTVNLPEHYSQLGEPYGRRHHSKKLD